MSVPVCVWDTCSTLLPVEPAAEKVAAASFILGRDPNIGAPGWAPAARQRGSGSRLLEMAAAPDIL